MPECFRLYYVLVIIKSKDTQYGALGKANHLLIFRVMLSQAGALYTNKTMIHQSKKFM